MTNSASTAGRGSTRKKQKCGCPKVAPESESLTFFTHESITKVHVAVYHDRQRQHPRASEFDAALNLTLGGQCRALCGIVARLDGNLGYTVETFPDEQLCQGCVRALGHQSPRAFEHAQSEEDSRQEA